VKIDNGHSDFQRREIAMLDSSFHFGGLVSQFVDAAQNGPPILPQGQEVSSFVHAFNPGNPVEAQGPPILPQGHFVSEFVHAAVNGPPILPQGQDVTSFVHELHSGFDGFSIDAMGWLL
jgi:uncharacterized Zn-binding protein involved in type VI secretion